MFQEKMDKIQKFDFDGKAIEFGLSKNILVNATEMGKVFGTDVGQFLRTKETKAFISECLNTANMQYLNIEKEEDLIVSNQKSGTFMHRILALKFAAWLNPRFELWVYATIDKLMFGHLNIEERNEVLKQKQAAVKELESLSSKMSENKEYQRLLELQALVHSSDKQLKSLTNQAVSSQLALFQ